ncbi:MAG: serine protease spb1 [Bdellovibrio sp. ArHS]|uniref:redoxin domain-containing protein n=1 Tax=Bdellovibrio sp. ArHS TaxID=1569284 RepID=UPI000583C007|nr:redoxin domain-containing protein [Bdellovibrio sp. ArHS]KHD89590.1 MAG: serine protease spb1 [Bdellovibrio sp. ArHS]
MQKLWTLLLLTLWASLSFAVPPLEGTDVISQKEIKIATTDKEATVVVFVSAKCPCSASHESLLKSYSAEFKNVQFAGIHANSDESPEQTQQHFAEAQLPFPVIQDRKSKLANELGALKTPHAFVFNKKGELVYHGGVTDSHVGPSAKKFFLKEVLEDLHAGKEPRHKEGRALGCYIPREDD